MPRARRAQALRTQAALPQARSSHGAKTEAPRRYKPARCSGKSKCAELSGVKLGVAGTRSAPEHRRRSWTLGRGFAERQRRRTEGAFGRHAADQPMRAAAARAVVDLAVVIDRVIAASVRVERGAAGFNRTQHGAFLRNHL